MEKYILQLGEMTWSKVIVVGLVVAGAYWGLYYDDGSSLETAIKTLQTRYTEADRQLRETKEAMADAEKFEKAIRQNEVQFEKVLEYLPQDVSPNQMTRLVNKLAQEAGTRVTSTRAIEQTERKDFYEMTKLELSIQGSFSQVLLFLAGMSKIQQLLTFEKLNMKLHTGTGAERVTNAPGSVVEMSGLLVGYRYMKDVAAGAADGGANATPTQ